MNNISPAFGSNAKNFVTAFVIMMMFVLPTGPISSVGGQGEVNEGEIIDIIMPGERFAPGYDWQIYTLAGAFDPLVDPSPAPISMRLNEPNGYYIIQANRMRDGTEKDQLMHYGVTIFSEFNNMGWLVHMSQETKEKVETLDFVRWIGNYEPAYKVDPALYGQIGDVKVYVEYFRANTVKGYGWGQEANQANEALDQLMKDKNDPDQHLVIHDQRQPRPELRDLWSRTDVRLSSILGLQTDPRMILLEQLGARIDPTLSDIEVSGFYVVEMAASLLPLLALQGEVRHITAVGGEPEYRLNQIRPYSGVDAAYATMGNTGGKWTAVVREGGSVTLEEPRYTHQEFGSGYGNVSQIHDRSGSVSAWHVTHTTAIWTSVGTDPDYRGIAPSTRVHKMYWDDNDAAVASYLTSVGGYMCSDSWGYTGLNNGGYHETSYRRDLEMWNHGEYMTDGEGLLFITSAGNSGGSATGPAIIEGSSNTVSSDSASKNGITAGAMSDRDTEDRSDDSYCDAAEMDQGQGSCTGFTDDDRHKPDLWAAGDMFYNAAFSADSTSDTAYSKFGGTSAASPIIGSSATVAQHAYVDGYVNNFLDPTPTSVHMSTVKAMLYSTSYQNELGVKSTRRSMGYGAVNLSFISDPNNPMMILNDADNTVQGGSQSAITEDIYSITALPGYDLRISLVWTDTPGPFPGIGNSFSGKTLNNDIDLEVTSDSTGDYWLGNRGLFNLASTPYGDEYSDNSPAYEGGTKSNPATSSPGNADHANNDESVFLGNPSGAYIVKVKGYDTPTGAIPYSLVVFGAPTSSAIIQMDAEGYGIGDVATITLVDSDKDTTGSPDTTTVHVWSDRDATGIDVTVTETGGNTGKFQGDFSFNPPNSAYGGGVSVPSANPPSIAVNEEIDTVHVNFMDTYPPPTRYPEATSTFRGLPPRISNVSIKAYPAKVTFEWDTDVPADSYLYLALDDPTAPKFDLDDDQWKFFSAYNSVSLSGIRNNEADTWLFSQDSTLVLHHSITMGDDLTSRLPPGEDLFFVVESTDVGRNTRTDDNGGEYYHVQTPDQGFELLLVADGGGYDAAGSIAEIAASHGVDFRYIDTSIGNIGLDNNLVLSRDFGAYQDRYTSSTLGNFLSGVIGNQASDKNVVYWDTGLAMADISEEPSYTRTLILDDIIPTYNTTDAGFVQPFTTNGGRIMHTGLGWAEDAEDDYSDGSVDMDLWMQTWLKVNPPTISGGSASYDVGDGGFSGPTMDLLYGAITANDQDGRIGDGTMDILSGMAYSGDELTSAGGSVAEWDWGRDGYNNEEGGYMAFSWTDGSARVFSSSGGSEPYYGASYAHGGFATMGMTSIGQSPIDGTDMEWLDDMWTNNIFAWLRGDITPTAFEGTVDDLSVPIEGAQVYAYLAGTDTVITGGRTNATGGYTFEIPPGTYDLKAVSSEYTEDVISSVTITYGQTLVRDFSLNNAGEIKGRVWINDPYYGTTNYDFIKVKAVGPVTKTTGCDPSGRYYLDSLPAGTYAVTAYGEEYITNTYLYYPIDNQTASGKTVTAGASTIQDFTLETGSISGRVTDAVTGAPIANAYVACWDSSQGTILRGAEAGTQRNVIRWVQTGIDGSYSLPVVGTGSYYVAAQANGFDHSRIWDNTMASGYSNETYNEGSPTVVPVVSGANTPEIDMTLTPSTGTLSGIAKLSTGTPVPGVRVNVSLTGPSWMVGAEGTELETWTGTDGSYSLELPAGTYYARAFRSDHHPDEAIGVVVSSGSTTTQDFITDLSGAPADVFLIFEYGDSCSVGSGDPVDEYNDVIREALAASSATVTEWNIFRYVGDYMYDDGMPTEADWAGHDIVMHFNSGDIYLQEGADYYGMPEEPADVVNRWDDDLMNFLDNGGNYVEMNHDYQYLLRVDPNQTIITTPLLQYMAQSPLDGDDDASGATIAKGYAGNPISGDWSSTGKDLLSWPSEGGHHYEDEVYGLNGDVFENQGSLPMAGLANTGNYKTIYFGFCVSDFTTTSGTADADTNLLFQNIINWMVPYTFPPIISDVYVDPAIGTTGTSFRYYVTYTSPNNTAPDEILIDIDGSVFDVIALGGQSSPGDTDYTDGKEYYIDRTGAQLGYGDDHDYSVTSAKDTAFINAYGDMTTHYGPLVTDALDPVITPDFRGDAPENLPAPVNATLVDQIAIAHAKLYFKRTVDGVYTALDMHKTGNPAKPEQYTGLVTGYPSGTQMEWYIQVWDFEGNMANYGTLGIPNTFQYGSGPPPLSYILITNTPDGTEVTTESRDTDDNAVQYYASGYDAGDNYLGLQSGNWAWSGAGLGTFSNPIGVSSVTVDYTTPGAQTIDFIGAFSDSTGTITVSLGAFDHISITDSAGGTEVTTEIRDTDDNAITYFASGYDADDNYLGLQVGNWAWSGAGLGTFDDPTSVSSVSVDYTTPGAQTIDFSGAFSDSTGTITVSVGALNYVSITDSADGSEVTTESRNTNDNAILYFASGYDADDNYISLVDGTWSWSGTSLGTFNNSVGVNSVTVDYTTVGAETLDFTGAFSDSTGTITVSSGGGSPPGVPTNITAARSGNDILLSWEAPISGDPPTGYRVYTDTDISDGFDYISPLEPGLTLSATMVGDYADANTYYYRVRAFNGVDENENVDNTAYKLIEELNQSVYSWNWVSIPYDSPYTMMSDVTDELTESNVIEVAKWNTADDGYDKRTWIGFWAGDYAIQPGETLRLTMVSDIDWVILGSYNATSIELNQSVYSWNWVSIPYDTSSPMMSDITDELTESNVIEVAKWNTADDGYDKRTWIGFWAGDYAIQPGEALRLTMVNDVNWEPSTI